MVDALQINSGFSYGELDPKLAARIDFAAYDRGVKTAQNVLSIPQGGFTRRFGTTHVDDLVAINKNYARIISLIYDDAAIYLMLFEHNTIKIYLQNTLLATVATTYPAAVIRRLRFAPITNRLTILHENFTPAQLVRSADAANAIAALDYVNNYVTVTNALTVGNIYPATFTSAGALPVTDPQLYINTLYYVKAITATDTKVYTTPQDATDDTNAYNITGAGIGNLVIQNTWTLGNIAFSMRPVYDFGGIAYKNAGVTFTANALTGTQASPCTITCSANIFVAGLIGGTLEGNGGILRIVTVPAANQVIGYTYEAFIDMGAFLGNESILTEPAWSAARGYPSCGTFFQERYWLGGSRAIPNGIWGSAISSPYDFDDSQYLDDNSISYYTASGQSNFIKSFTASKSLVVHTNTGNYSTALTIEVPLTPSTFFLSEQNTDGIASIDPVSVDNQIIYTDRSARNIKSMSWDIVQSSYINTNISIPSSHLIKTPIDMDVFREPKNTDGYYVVCVNEDGTLGIYNSLVEQEIKGWTKADTAQNDIAGVASPGYFWDCATGLNKGWVIVERTVNGATTLALEEFDFEVRTDASLSYDFAVATNLLTGLDHLIGQTIQVYADGATHPDVVVNIHGEATLDRTVTKAFAGLKFTSTISPMPVNIQLQNGPSLYQSVKIRGFQIHYYESIGVTIQGKDISTIDVTAIVTDPAATPTTGVFEYNLMEGWDAFTYSIDIVQDKPLPFTLLGIGYNVEI